jgi:amino acid adenylation domain-containing protein/non-ribosomal peptide synthase protein (TIGR01720 family)
VDIFKPETIERLISNFNVLLTAIVQNPAAALNELELVTAGEKAVMTDLFNDTAMAYQKHSTLVTMFEQQVRERPEAIALVYGNETLTYQQLNERSNRLANFLITEKRLQKSNPVAVSMGRSPGLIIAILAVLKTGCYYVPVDPDYPADRRDFMIKDGGIELVLVNNESQDLYIDPVASYNVDTIPGEFNAANPEVEILSSDLCYIIYTSGSTGLPKGVMVEHGNVVNLLHGCNRHFAFTSEDVWSLFHSVSFDFSVWEIFGSLTTGGRLVLVSLDEARDAEAFASLLSEKKVTVLNQVPTMFGQLAEEIAGNPVPLSLRYVIFGGEALNPGMLKNWHNSYSEVKLVNMYGITETTVHVTFKEITAAEIEGGQSNIGTPLGNVKLYIMDSDHQLMPIGAVGEIVVGGAGVSRGYLNRQELNNERFINNPFSPGEFLYCSGDLGLQLSGGEVVYKGRGDDQVKIRGYRIELGEIERSLLQHAAINAAVVVKHTAAQGSAQLVAYIVGDKQLTVQEMRSYLAESLPDYMLPSHFIQINSLPVTANGKVNRALLPEPQFQAMDNGTVYEEPVTEHEQELAAIWKEVLGRDRISIADNFFEIGGDSIKAIQIASKIFRTGYKITVREIFQFPTIKELALCFKKVERIPEQSLITGEFPLTPVQADFFAASVINPHHYNQAVMLFYEQRFDRDILQRTIAQIQEHHDQLRVTFRKNSNGAIVQSVSGTDHPVSIAYFDLRNATDPYGEMNSLSNSIQSGIDLENGPLMKLGLFSLSDGDRLLIVIHHLAIDGVSWRIIFEDLESIYRQALEGRETPLPLKTDSYKLWAEKINVYADSKSLLEEKKYWKNLDLVNVVPLRPDRETAMNNLADTGGMSFTLTAEETELLLTKVHVPYNTQINDILLVALGLSVKNHFGLPQTLIALEGHGRESILGDIDISRTIGWFTSIYPVLITPVQDNNLSLAIREVKEMLNKIPARGVGYGILKYLTAEANKQDISLTVNPPISFNYLGQFDTDVKNTFFQVSGEPKGNIRDISGERRYEFDISGMIAGGILKITIEYNKTRFSETTISGFMDAYKEALSRVISFCCTVSEKESSPSDFGFKELSINELETFFD